MITQIRRSRLIGDPPHVLLDVNLEDFTILEFNRAKEAIGEGRACVARADDALSNLSKYG